MKKCPIQIIEDRRFVQYGTEALPKWIILTKNIDSFKHIYSNMSYFSHKRRAKFLFNELLEKKGVTQILPSDYIRNPNMQEWIELVDLAKNSNRSINLKKLNKDNKAKFGTILATEMP